MLPQGLYQTCVFTCACEHVHMHEWLASLFPKHSSQHSLLCQLKALHVFLLPAIEEQDNSLATTASFFPSEHSCDNHSLAFTITNIVILPCDVSVIPDEGLPWGNRIYRCVNMKGNPRCFRLSHRFVPRWPRGINQQGGAPLVLLSRSSDGRLTVECTGLRFLYSRLSPHFWTSSVTQLWTTS